MPLSSDLICELSDTMLVLSELLDGIIFSIKDLYESDSLDSF